MSTPDPLEYYRLPGIMTDPRQYAHLFAGLPADLPSLVQTVQNNLVHVFWAERYGLKLTEEQKVPVTVRDVASKLAIIQSVDPRPLVEPRPVEQRLVSNCRDFTVVLVSMLRHLGIPARARCGFGAYFLPDHLEDHWVAEVWNADQGRWVLVDAQMDALQREVLSLPFDPLDVPRSQFVVAGQAWQMCRSGAYDWDKCGIFEWHGLWFVRGNVVRDILAFQKIEILPWDGGWGVLSQLDEQHTEPDVRYELFDRLAELTQCGNESFADQRAIYENEPGLHIPEAWLLDNRPWPIQ